jgi:hypothetical protein
MPIPQCSVSSRLTRSTTLKKQAARAVADQGAGKADGQKPAVSIHRD